jgi:hypothetical protein
MISRPLWLVTLELKLLSRSVGRKGEMGFDEDAVDDLGTATGSRGDGGEYSVRSTMGFELVEVAAGF